MIWHINRRIISSASRSIRKAGSIALDGFKVLGCLVVLAGSTIWTQPAAASDRVVMPYRCEALGGDIKLTPSEPRQYEIYGKREQDIVTACAPDNPNRCRTWRLHKFTMNCGGARVPWIDVVASANTLTGGPANVRDGRLYIRMDPWWSRQRPPIRDNRPGLREFDDPDQRPDNFRYPPSARAPSVEMPPGFAPVAGMTAQFIDGPPGAGDARTNGDNGALADRGPPEAWDYGTPGSPAAQKPGPSPSTPPKIATAPPQTPTAPAATAIPSPAPKTSTRDAGHTFAPKSDEKKSTEPAPPVAAIPPGAKPENQKVAAAPETPPAPAATAVPPSPATVPGPNVEPTINSIAPTILNRPGAETTAITSASSSSGDKSGTDAAGAAGDAISANLESAPGTLPLLAPLSRNGPAILGVAALAMLGAAGAYVMRRRSEAGLGTRTAVRDLSAVSLDATQSRALTTVPLGEPPSEPPAQGKPPPPASLAHALKTKAPAVETFVTAPMAEPEWIPSTREEALHVLGASPDASEAVLKKIVDGLRMSWHPDHAKTTDDHRLRSERMTQINVAWDILTGRQAAARPQV